MTDALDAVRSGGNRAVAGALVRLETNPEDCDAARLLDAAWRAQDGVALGLTGPPGVGKSTLLNGLIARMRSRGLRVAVIAIDPSSKTSRGALLGDRTRLMIDPSDDAVFVRSMAARDRLGGISEQTFPATILLRALFDVVIVETVGVGQSETEISMVADLTAVCVQPGSGDSLQFIKAGIAEIPDLFVVTKADLGAIACRTQSDLRSAVALSHHAPVPVIKASAQRAGDMEHVLQEICTALSRLRPRLTEARRRQLIRWHENQILHKFGREGWQLFPKSSVDNVGNDPFRDAFDKIERVRGAFTAAFR